MCVSRIDGAPGMGRWGEAEAIPYGWSIFPVPLGGHHERNPVPASSMHSLGMEEGDREGQGHWGSRGGSV